MLKNSKIEMTLVVDMIKHAPQVNEIVRQIGKKIHLLLKIAISQKFISFGVPQVGLF